MYPWIPRIITYPLVYGLRGEPVDRFRQEIGKFHTLSREEMDRVQSDKLNRLLSYLYANNDFYRPLLSKEGFDPEDLSGGFDFEELPFLTKPLIQRFERGMISSGHFRLSNRHTSGSSGDPMGFAKDRAASACMDAMMHEMYSWHGIELGDRQARVWGTPITPTHRLMARAKDLLFNHRRLLFFDLSTEKSVKFFRQMLQFRPRCIYGVTNCLCEFARVLIRAGHNPADIGMDVVIATSEIMSPNYRSLLERAFGCRVVDEYGCSETGIIAFECPSGSMHLANHNLFVEVVSLNNQGPVPDGELGEIVITELHSYGMPFVRYRIGDLGRIATRPCGCGRASPVLENIEGRIAGMIETADGARMSMGVVAHCLPEGITKFRLIQRSPELLGVIVAADEQLPKSVFEEIRRKILKEIGHPIKVDIRQVDDIPRDRSGKIRAVISDLDINYQ
jgi:phenylacetate-CoA ligase